MKYSDDGKHAEFNGERFTRDERTGYYLTTNNNKRPGRRLHRAVWEYYNGEIPKGYDVHHIDHDKTNNDIQNLTLLKRGDHVRLHSKEDTDERIEQKLENLRGNARPLAAEWHRTEDGKKWHKAHYEEMKPKLHTKITRACEFCGTEYETEAGHNNRFCSNRCKSAWRRSVGANMEERTCVVCGNTFSTDRYKHTQTCSPKCASAIKRAG